MNSTYFINRIMSNTFPSSSASGYYIGLSSTKPNAAGTNVSEPVGNNYSRVQVTAFTSPQNGVVKNKYALQFQRSGGTWFYPGAPGRYWVLFDGSGQGAHVLSCGTIKYPLVILGNASVTIEAESICITLRDME